MKRESFKTIALALLAGAFLMQAAQTYTQAGPQPPAPRVVPVTLSSLVPPSKMVAVSAILHPTDRDGVVQPDINLEPGDVFILTAVTSRVALSSSDSEPTNDAGGLRAIRRGTPTGPTVAYTKAVTGGHGGATTSPGEPVNFFQTTYPTGIRFARTPNGKADLFLVGRTSTATGGSSGGVFFPTDIPDVTLHGYITNDY